MRRGGPVSSPQVPMPRQKIPPRGAPPQVDVRAGAEHPDLASWVQRYVALVMETDAERRSAPPEGGAGPPSPG